MDKDEDDTPIDRGETFEEEWPAPEEWFEELRLDNIQRAKDMNDANR